MSMVASWKEDPVAGSAFRNKSKESYEKYSAEQKLRDDLEGRPSNRSNDDELTRAQTASAADFVVTGRMVRQPSWDQLSEPVHPSYDEIFGPEPPRPKARPDRESAWKLFASTADRFSAMLPGGVIQDHGAGANTYTSGKYSITVMPRPSGQPSGIDETSVLAMAAWGAAHSTCNFVRMGGAECDVRPIGRSILGGHAALLYRLDQISCSTISGVLAVVSTDDRIFVVLTQAGDENSADVKRFLNSFKIDQAP
jgi:hypothetical protein